MVMFVDVRMHPKKVPSPSARWREWMEGQAQDGVLKMRPDDPSNWMWSEALAMLTRAERMHRSLFQPRAAAQQGAWEPPADVLEMPDEVLILIALPGIDPDTVDAAIHGDNLLVAGRRLLPPQLRSAVVHRLELPHGRFERSVPLPPGRYTSVERSAAYGCVLFSLRKSDR